MTPYVLVHRCNIRCAGTTWDYIFIGGGLAGSVVASRLSQLDSSLKVLVIEAGPNANNEPNIVWSSSTNLIGGDFDWEDSTVSQRHLDGRKIGLATGKALGGGTVINGGGWVRGRKFDFDLWGSLVQDKRWTYEGQLLFMQKSERCWNGTSNLEQHGSTGPVPIQSVTSTKREFPLRKHTLDSWKELGFHELPHLDGNAGDPLGIAELQEGRDSGRRVISAAVYSLESVTVLTNTLVEKILIEKQAAGNDRLKAVGVRLADSTEIHGREIILAAGALRSPQILLRSGIGPATDLNELDIPVLLDQPEVGRNLADHSMLFTAWKVKDSAGGWALGSPNPLFSQPQYGWGHPFDFLVCSDVAKKGLAAAIAGDEGGVVPDPATHPLLAYSRIFIEYIFMLAGAPDGSLVTFGAAPMLPTARGTIKFASANCSDPPLIDPNYLGTAVDRYVAREAVKMQIKFAGSNATVVGREILDGEAGAPGVDGVLSVDSTDDYIDARIRAGLGTCQHPMGSLSMGKVVDVDLRVKGVDSLRVVDASVFPVVLTGHIQAAVYALAEQAAGIIYADRLNFTK
ncbi:putative GMC oxidoreductase [Xylaria palmicola]|nr:putative GMC oxidoreductase [Xylaria palmicola]